MLSSLVITVIGPDRPGIVSAISDKAVEFGANWTDRKSTRLNSSHLARSRMPSSA